MAASSGNDQVARARTSPGAELFAKPAEENHLVQFYEEEHFLRDVVVDFVAAGIMATEPVVVIATEVHRDGFSRGLAAKGIDVEQATRAGRVTLLDARETMATFMVDGKPDRDRFRQSVGGVLEKTSAVTGRARIRAYGEMVDLLWRDGNPEAAIRLEELWNEIGKLHSFSLLCGYSMGNFRQEADGRPFADVCRAHSHVYPSETYTEGPAPDVRLRDIALLQQKNLSLENEIEHRKRIEQALVEALRFRDDFLSVAGHELRTPITALKLQLETLLRAVARAGDESMVERVSKARRQTDRLTALTEGLLDVSRIGAGRLILDREDMDLASIVREAVDRATELASRSGCRIRLVADESVAGHWDRARLEQVVDNLLSNAIKYGQGSPVEVLVKRTAGQAELKVHDGGPGIAVEDQERVFDRFERATTSKKINGLGLGLWIAREIVQSHGGTIRVESQPGKGAHFSVKLPCA